MTYPNPFGMGGGGGFAVGPANNIFGATSGAADAIPLTVTPAANRAAAEAVRDAYATANPSWLSEYDGDTSIGIFLFWTSSGDNLMVGQTRIGGQWFDQVSITGVQGVPGSGTDFSNITPNHIPAIGSGPDFVPFDSGLRVIPNTLAAGAPGTVATPGSLQVGVATLRLEDQFEISGGGETLNFHAAARDQWFTPVMNQLTASGNARAIGIEQAAPITANIQPVFDTTLTNPDFELTASGGGGLAAYDGEIVHAFFGKTPSAQSNILLEFYLQGQTSPFWSQIYGTWPAGDFTISVDSPVGLYLGQTYRVKVSSTNGGNVQMLGNSSGVPFLSATLRPSLQVFMAQTNDFPWVEQVLTGDVAITATNWPDYKGVRFVNNSATNRTVTVTAAGMPALADLGFRVTGTGTITFTPADQVDGAASRVFSQGETNSVRYSGSTWNVEVSNAGTGPVQLSLEQLTDVSASSPTVADSALLAAINNATSNQQSLNKTSGQSELTLLWPYSGSVPADATTVLTKITPGSTVGFNYNQTGGATGRIDFAVTSVRSSQSGASWLVDILMTADTALSAALATFVATPGTTDSGSVYRNNSLTKFAAAFDGNIAPGDILYRNAADTLWQSRQLNTTYPLTGNGTTTPLKIGPSTRNTPGDVLTYQVGGTSDFLPLPTPTNINLFVYSYYLATPESLADVKASLPTRTPTADWNIGSFSTTLSESSPGNYYVTVVIPASFAVDTLTVGGTGYALSVIGDLAYKGVDYRVYRTPSYSVPLNASPSTTTFNISDLNFPGVYYFTNVSSGLTPAQVESNFSEGQKLFDWQPGGFSTFQILAADNFAKYVYIAIPSDEVITAINSRLAGGANQYGSIGVQFMFYVTYGGRNYGIYRSNTGSFAVTGSTFDVQFMAMQAATVASSNLYFYQDSVVETLDTLKARLGNAYVLSDWNISGSSTSVAFNSTTGYSVYTNIAIPSDCTITSIQVGPTVGPLVVQTYVFLGTFVYQGQSYNAYRTTSTIAETAGVNYTLRFIASPCPSICAKQVTGGFSARGQTLVYNPTSGNLEVSQPIIGGFPVATTTPTNQYLLRYSSFTNTWNPDFDRLSTVGWNGVAGSSGQVPVLDTTNGWWAWGSATGNAGAVYSRRKSTGQTINGDTRISWDTVDTNNASSLNVNLSYDGVTNVGRFTNSTGQGMSLIVSWHGVFASTAQHATNAFATWLRCSWSGTSGTGGSQRYGFTDAVGSPDFPVLQGTACIWLDDTEWFEIWAWSTLVTTFGNAGAGEGAGFSASVSITRVNP